MAEIRIKLEGQLLMVQNQEIIASGNVNYDTCAFTFDGAWEGFVRTAVFYQKKTEVHYAILGGDNICTIPSAAMAGEGNMYIGVFGISGPKVLTSTVERVYIRQGAISGDTVSAEPADDIFLAIIAQYRQISERMQGYDLKMEEFIGILNALNAYDVADVMGRLTGAEERIGNMEAAVKDVSDRSGGLRFAQDANGDWGYIVPDSEEVIPFWAGGGGNDETVIKRYKWELVECDDVFNQNGYTWIAVLRQNVHSDSNRQHLFLAVKVPQACQAIMTLKFDSESLGSIYLNNKVVYERNNMNDSNRIPGQTILLEKGTNYLLLETYRVHVSTSVVNTQIFLPPVAI